MTSGSHIFAGFLRATRRADDDGFAAGRRRDRTRARQRREQRHFAGQLILAGRTHLAQDQDPLAAIVLDRRPRPADFSG